MTKLQCVRKGEAGFGNYCIITQQFGFEEVDTTKWQNLRFESGEQVKTLGQLAIFVCLGTLENLRWREVTFEVVPNSFVRDRFDSVLSDSLRTLDPSLARTMSKELSNMRSNRS